MTTRNTWPPYTIVTYSTTVGLLYAFFTNEGLAALRFASTKPQQAIIADGNDLNTVEIKYYATHLGKQLQSYFSGQKVTFDVPLAIVQGTPFSRSVWGAISSVPYGQTAGYGDLAASIGYPKASRAVAQQVAKNPVAIVVPCHRILGHTGALVGFVAGLTVKGFLLSLERQSI